MGLRARCGYAALTSLLYDSNYELYTLQELHIVHNVITMNEFKKRGYMFGTARVQLDAAKQSSELPLTPNKSIRRSLKKSLKTKKR
jgi:hypothetical protein